MGKTYRRDNQFRPKKHGQVFTKDKPWKKNKKQPVDPFECISPNPLYVTGSSKDEL